MAVAGWIFLPESHVSISFQGLNTTRLCLLAVALDAKCRGSVAFLSVLMIFFPGLDLFCVSAEREIAHVLLYIHGTDVLIS